MNVYVRELVSSLAQAGADCTVFVRRWKEGLADVVEVEPGFRVEHITAGRFDLTKEALPSVVDEYTEAIRRRLVARPVDVIHANYWLSGVAGHQLKHALDLPLVATFHTLARVKAENGDSEPRLRIGAESEVVKCSDVITANSATEVQQLIDLYGADPDRINIVAPGVDHAFFSPGSRAGARIALGLGDEPVLLFVGRIQPLKGVDVAVEALACLDCDETRMLIVGGSSGRRGDHEVERIQELIGRHGLDERIEMVSPLPHYELSTFYRAADVCLVPSRSESFGLVALEAAACGTPVVASDVGGLRTLVDDGVTGFRVVGREPCHYADATQRILGDSELAMELSANAARMAAGYTWAETADRLSRIYHELSVRVPVDCLA